MKKFPLLAAVLLIVLNSCVEDKNCIEHDFAVEKTSPIYDTLHARALQNVDRSKWDLDLYKQDVEIYHRMPGVFDGFPLTKSPFPVAYYEYAVSSKPMTIQAGKHLFKGVRIGEFVHPDSDIVKEKLTLLILTQDKDADDNVLVESRNYPYLTAQGTFKEPHSKYDWVFAASPDGFSTLLVNMKLFDLRFGETIIIYPQSDKSFLYDQIDDSPNNHKNMEAFELSLVKKMRMSKVLNLD